MDVLVKLNIKSVGMDILVMTHKIKSVCMDVLVRLNIKSVGMDVLVKLHINSITHKECAHGCSCEVKYKELGSCDGCSCDITYKECARIKSVGMDIRMDVLVRLNIKSVGMDVLVILHIKSVRIKI